MSFEQLLREGNRWIESEDPRQAIPCFVQILQSDPDHVVALAGLAKATLQLNDTASAWTMLEMALALAPDDPDVNNTAGYAQMMLGAPEKALDHYERALRSRPNDPGVLLNLASALSDTGAYDRAEQIYARLIAEGRDDATAQYNHALVMLVHGRLAEAWPGFERRREAANTGLARREMPGRPWDGSECPDETLFIHAEQGLGDNLQFVRYLPIIAGRAKRIILEAPEALIDLFAPVIGIDALIPRGGPLPAADRHASIMSLPALCGTTAETVPASVPYLALDPEGKARWSARLGTGDGRLHVGLVWAGNPDHRRDRERSIPIELMADGLRDLPDCAFHAFQVGAPLSRLAAADILVEIDVLFPELGPLAEVSAALQAVDLLITVDTALAHLAGSLALPVWTLITRVPDWRWMLDCPDTPWYPTMRLFRQPAPGDWQSVMADLRSALSEEQDARL